MRRNFSFLFISLITNGSLLTPQRGLELWEAGLDELSISLDFLDQRHDRGRGIPGLTDHILSVVPELKAAGVNLCINVVIKKENFRETPQILLKAAEMGIKVSFSTYNCWRTENDFHMIGREDLPALEEVIVRLKRLKRSLGNLTSGDYYLDGIPAFFAHKAAAGCTAGLNWVQVTPDGMIKRCSDKPPVCHFDEWERHIFKRTDCNRCWYSCRGAAQEPWTVKRFLEMARDALFA